MATYNESTPALARVQYDVLGDTVSATAFFQTSLVNSEDPSDTVQKPWTSVAFDLPAELAAQIKDLASAKL